MPSANKTPLKRPAVPGLPRQLSILLMVVVPATVAIFLLSGKLAAKQAALATSQLLTTQFEQSATQQGPDAQFATHALNALRQNPSVASASFHIVDNRGLPVTPSLEQAEQQNSAQQTFGSRATQALGFTLTSKTRHPTAAGQFIELELSIHQRFLPQWSLLGWISLALTLVAAPAIAQYLFRKTAEEGDNNAEPQPGDPSTSTLAFSADAFGHRLAGQHSRTDEVTDNLLEKTELQLANERALEVNRFKTRLIATTSHELLTPLNSIIGFSNLLTKQLRPASQGTFDSAQTEKYIQYILENAGHLHRLVNDLVVYADQQKKQLTLNYSSVNLHSFLDSVSSSLLDDIQAKGLQLSTEYSSVAQLFIDTDPVRLRQILYNLINNAIRHTQSGTITLAAAEKHENGSPLLQLSVSDTGSGIDPAQQKDLFSAFISHQNTVSDEYSPTLGLGLGLSIVSHLTELLGGQVSVQSVPGEGSCFTLLLPLRRSDTTNTGREAAPREPTDYQPLSLLVVDDNRSNALLIREQLKGLPWSIQEAASGEEAIALASTNNFDIVLLDIRMHPMDGYQVYTAIRKFPHHQATPLLACTAHTSNSEYQKLLAFGFAGVLHKPLAQDKIRHGIALACNADCDELVQPTQASAPPTGLAKDYPHFDINVALQRSSNNPEVARSVFKLLLEDLEAIHRECQQGVPQQSEVLLDTVHRIHGGASLSGTVRLKQMAENAEEQLKNEGGESASAEALFDYLATFLLWVSQQPCDEWFTTK